ncbi:glycosyltransferase [Flavicella sediminum]|uniref:glycosyltransferase n=1 Tax=Flavicella sediminum TaxID=2585141 RepID=UPI0011224918|nr:glycosyltransferase [Flavicella sediminum]
MLLYLFYAFIVICAIQVIYYLFFSTGFSSNKKQKFADSPPISVLVCAKNEAENLKETLPLILKQNYSNDFELVLINDRSTDDTAEVMEDFAEKHKHIKIVNIQDCENFWGNKKYALTLGIKAAKYEHLLFTDADCIPLNDLWIEDMASQFSKNKTIVLGYGAYAKIKYSFLNKLIRFETLLTAIQYFSYANAGNPYMGVGRNLAYTKSDFFKVNGFIKHIKIKSGDDDLLINEIANKQNTICNISNNSFTVSKPETNFKDWILQKRRHVSTAKHYKLKHKLLLGLFYTSQISFFLFSILLLSFNFQLKIVGILIFIRYFFFYLSIGLSSKRLNEKDLILWAPITEITLIFMQFVIFVKNKISAPTHW